MTLVVFVNRSSSISDDVSSPLSGVGMCGGYALTTPDGKTRVGYSCARKNKNGDAWSDAGTLEPGAERGSWRIVGGTGALANKSGSGWWQQTLSDGKVTVGVSGGTCD